jgi:hypothetical protein
VPQTVAQGAEPADRDVEFLRAGRKPCPVDLRPAVGREHASDLIERKAGRAPERDQRQALDHPRIEQPPQSAPAHRRDQSAAFVIAERRGRHARALRHLRDVEVTHGLRVTAVPICACNTPHLRPS